MDQRPKLMNPSLHQLVKKVIGVIECINYEMSIVTI